MHDKLVQFIVHYQCIQMNYTENLEKLIRMRLEISSNQILNTVGYNESQNPGEFMKGALVYKSLLEESLLTSLKPIFLMWDAQYEADEKNALIFNELLETLRIVLIEK